MAKCEECGQEIDESKEGFGHRKRPVPCGHYTFRVNPEVVSFIQANPNATSAELAKDWIDKVLKREEEDR